MKNFWKKNDLVVIKNVEKVKPSFDSVEAYLPILKEITGTDWLWEEDENGRYYMSTNFIIMKLSAYDNLAASQALEKKIQEKTQQEAIITFRLFHDSQEVLISIPLKVEELENLKIQKKLSHNI